MFARLMHIQAQAGRLDEVVAMYWESVAPALRTQEGFHSTLLLTDPSTQSGMSISVWHSEAARSANTSSSAFQDRVRMVAPLLQGPPRAQDLVAHWGPV